MAQATAKYTMPPEPKSSTARITDATGQFTQASYDALVRLTAWLCDTAGIGRDQVIRHYDVTGKLCPLYFVEHEEAWTQFLADVAAY